MASESDWSTRSDSTASCALEGRGLERLRARLKRFVDFRLDERIGSRVEASDIVQDTFVHAAARWSHLSNLGGEHLYRLLRRMAMGCVLDSHRRHLRAERRSVLRERSCNVSLGGKSGFTLGDVLASSSIGPGDKVSEAELLARLWDALRRLSAGDRELLVLRHIRQHDVAELAVMFHTSRTVITTRHLRAIRRLRRIWDAEIKKSSPCGQEHLPGANRACDWPK